jgi:hypothetical protein
MVFEQKRASQINICSDETRIAQAVGFSRMTPLWFPTSASRHAPYFIATMSVAKFTFIVNSTGPFFHSFCRFLF